MKSVCGSLRTIFLVTVVVLLTITRLFGTTAAMGDTGNQHFPPDIQAIKDRGQLVVAMVASDRMPFFFVNNQGELAGIDVDMAKSIADYLGVDVIFDRSAPTFDDAVQLIVSGIADVAITKLSVTLPRAKQVLFTTPYVSLPQGLLINRVLFAATGRQNEDPMVVINDPGVTVGVLRASSYVEFAKRLLPRAKLIEYEPKEALFQAVYDGEITALLYDENEIKQYIYESPDRLIDLQIAMIPGAYDDIAMAVPWQSTHLHLWLNQVIAQDRLSFTVDDLIKRYQR